MKRIFTLTVLLGSFLFIHAQPVQKIHWWNPQNAGFHVIEGQGWPDEMQGAYFRLPPRAKSTVRNAVWNLSQNASGLMIRFRTNASQIIVRYVVKSRFGMNHMPPTGVSGLDLYAKNSDGRWLWSAGRYAFADTIVCRFKNINPNDRYHKLGREYRLSLPLYNTVAWMEIGVPDKALFSPLPVRAEKPIVVYGTSIAHGACASRPGMAWPNILAREMDRPLINLAFSGNGRLEPELINLMNELDPEIYILDCLPNLWNQHMYSTEEVFKRIIESVRSLKNNHPGVPVLLTDHDGYADGSINRIRRKAYLDVNKVQAEAFAQLKSEGFTGIYRLTRKEINMPLDAMVDGTHSSDLGMQYYANAYEKKLREILNEPVGKVLTTQPCTQYREPAMYDWEARHETLLRLNREQPPRTIFIGNSITHYWAGEPEHRLHRGVDSWKAVLDPLGTRNFGFGWDRIENVLWRVYHDELDGYLADRVIINIGTNNLQLNSDEEILEGMELLLKAIINRQPQSKILLTGLYPRRNQEERIRLLNLKYAQLAGKLNIGYADLGEGLLLPNGKIDETLFVDGLHPNTAGYRRIADVLLKKL